jgi:hypothetical protein
MMNQMDGKGQLVTGLPVHRCHRCVIRLVDDLYIFFYRRCRIIYFSLTLVHAYRWISASVSLAVGGRPIHRIPFFFQRTMELFPFVDYVLLFANGLDICVHCVCICYK